MHFTIKTQVRANFQSTVDRFQDPDLLKQLSPPFPPVKLLRFDGSYKGARVILELNFILFKQVWESVITDDHQSEDEFWFVDEGKKLPFFLGYWRHLHIVRKEGEHVWVIDDVRYRGRWGWTTPFLFPLLYLQFLYRKPRYRRLLRSSGS